MKVLYIQLLNCLGGKKISYKVLFSILITIGLIAGSIYIFIQTLSNEFSDVEFTEKIETPIGHVYSTVISDEEFQEFENKNKNPFGTEVKQKDLTDNNYDNFIHGMSHQKVQAKAKWVFYEMHPERIDWLLEGLEVAEIGQAKGYKEILERWKDGDFSQADKDHNRVWNNLGGTKGEADGLLSETEEQHFIKKSYR